MWCHIPSIPAHRKQRQANLNLSLTSSREKHTKTASTTQRNFVLNKLKQKFKNSYKEARKHFEMYKNETTVYENLWDIVKSILGGKTVAINAFPKN